LDEDGTIGQYEQLFINKEFDNVLYLKLWNYSACQQLANKVIYILIRVKKSINVHHVQSYWINTYWSSWVSVSISEMEEVMFDYWNNWEKIWEILDKSKLPTGAKIGKVNKWPKTKDMV
jgi:hypothetical protein